MSYIQITLKSDTCIGSGEIFNCLVDSDVCYDKYGLPYIPAKRVKGCLRETAQELEDWGYDISVDDIFGSPGNSSAKIHISNAMLCQSEVADGNTYNYEEYLEDIEKSTYKQYATRQLVLEQFTYVRTQTAMDYEAGTAKRNSLRTTRVLKKGLTFRSNVSFSSEMLEDSEVVRQMKDCCMALKSMGLNRTRGMGEISAKFIYQQENDEVTKKSLGQNYLYNLSDGRQKLKYTLHLKAPLLTRNISAGQSVTETYIEGSKVLGFLVHHVDMNFNEFMDLGELICSNAYLSIDGKRYLPISEAWNGVKNEKRQIRDKTVSEEKQLTYKESLGNSIEQLKSLGDIYVEGNTEREIHALKVDTEIRYHHSRPKDKSIGRANAKMAEQQEVDKDKTGEFYQLESLCAGQEFTGYVIGAPEQMQQVLKIFEKHKTTRMGYNRSCEYGEVEFIVNQYSEESTIENECKEFIVKLEAPMIQYNAQGMYTTEAISIVDELMDILGDTKLRIKKEFLKFKMLRGYNTKWEMRKPIIYAFDKGTTLVVEVEGQEEGVLLSKLSNVWLGERVNEGFGEISVYPIGQEYQRKILQKNNYEMNKELVAIDKTKLISNVVRKLVEEKIVSLARVKANEKILKLQANENTEILKPLIYGLWNQLLQDYGMCSVLSKEDLSKLRKEGNKEITLGKSRRANKKHELVKKVLEEVPIDKLVSKDKKQYVGIQDDEIRYVYIHALIEEMKYQVNTKKGGDLR